MEVLTDKLASSLKVASEVSGMRIRETMVFRQSALPANFTKS